MKMNQGLGKMQITVYICENIYLTVGWGGVYIVLQLMTKIGKSV